METNINHPAEEKPVEKEKGAEQIASSYSIEEMAISFPQV